MGITKYKLRQFTTTICGPKALEIYKGNGIMYSNEMIKKNRESGNASCSVRSQGFVSNHMMNGTVSTCEGLWDFWFTQQLHSLVLKNGSLSDGYFITELVNSYSKNGHFDDAVSLFSDIHTENVVCWNAIIAGAVRNRELFCAFDIFLEMVDGFCMPNGFTLSSVLSACAHARELHLGRGIHAWVLKCNERNDVFIGTALVDLYAKCGDMEAAVRVFLRMHVHNVVSWTTIISGFANTNEPIHALPFFKQMLMTEVEINKFTITSVLAACSRSLIGYVAFQVHSLVLKNGLFEDFVVKKAFISTYAKTGYMEMGEKLIEEVDVGENDDAWSVLISGLVQDQNSMKSVGLYRRMYNLGLRPDKFCTCSILSVIDCEYFGQQVHCHAVKSGLVLDVLVACAIFTMYSKCNNLRDSYLLFSEMPERDTAAWSSMIAGLAEHGHEDAAFRLFIEMLHDQIELDSITLSAILASCRGPQALRKGKEIHAHTFRLEMCSDNVVVGALIRMYSKCSSFLSAMRVFNAAREKDQMMWSFLVCGCVANNFNEEALLLFHKMVLSGIRVDSFTCSSVLGLCASLFKQALGRQLHSLSIKTGIFQHLTVNSALVSMYAKCGYLDDSRKAFNEIGSPDLVLWTAMIDAYASNGRGMEALELFSLMKDCGMMPDSVTMVEVLSACSHGGMVDEGFLHFNSMKMEYGIDTEMHHYACMVDLLCRSGRLEEAAFFINKMPIEPDLFIWSTLAGACRVYGNVELARVAAEKVLVLEPNDSGAYVSLSNISAERGNWEEVVRIRSSLGGFRFDKDPGWSSLPNM